MIKHLAASAALAAALSVAGAASASVVTFDVLHSATTLPALGPHYDEAGLSFDVTALGGGPEQIGSFGYNIAADADPVGAAIFVNAQFAQITITKLGGGAFTLNSIDLTDQANGQVPRQNYNLAYSYVDGGGLHSSFFALDSLPGLQTFTLNLTGLQSFTMVSGALNASIDPGVQLDNVRFNEPVGGPAPEPVSWSLMLTGFGGLGAMLRRKRARALSA
jgi:hypothetical protein